MNFQEPAPSDQSIHTWCPTSPVQKLLPQAEQSDFPGPTSLWKATVESPRHAALGRLRVAVEIDTIRDFLHGTLKQAAEDQVRFDAFLVPYWCACSVCTWLLPIFL